MNLGDTSLLEVINQPTVLPMHPRRSQFSAKRARFIPLPGRPLPFD